MTNAVEQRVIDLVAPLAAERGAEVFDVEYAGGVVRVYLDREGGVDIDVLSAVSRELSHLLDEHDPIPGRYTLEVSSPGLERSLRTPAHYRWAIRREVNVRRVGGVEGDRRLSGTVTAADDDAVTLLLDSGAELVVPYGEIDRARTTFRWGGQPKPGSKKSSTSQKAGAKAAQKAPKTEKAGG